MNSKELIEQSKEEIAMFHRPARATSCLMMEMVESQAVKIAELEKELVELRKANAEDESKPLLKKLLNCCDGLSTEYAQSNYGAANAWVRHIDSAYQNYQEGIDECEAKELKDTK